MLNKLNDYKDFEDFIKTYITSPTTFVISRSWVRVPQMAPRPNPLKTMRFKGFSFARGIVR